MDKVSYKIVYFFPKTAFVVFPKPSIVWGKYGPLANLPPSFKQNPARKRSINRIINKSYSILQLLIFSKNKYLSSER